VTGPREERGIYFLSLDASRAAAVVAARLGYGLRYSWARMRYRKGDVLTYESSRLFPGPTAGARIAVAVEERLERNEVSDRDAWFTERRRYYCVRRGRLLTGIADHEPWPLRSARVLHCDENLVAACGLPPTRGEPLALFSAGVLVRMSKLERVESPIAALS
jgi:uncharacterized protein YqjF (DUF2071 family)